MTYTNWSLVAETPLPNGNRGAIAKRNIELNGGTIAIATGADGTTVEVALPRA